MCGQSSISYLILKVMRDNLSMRDRLNKLVSRHTVEHAHLFRNATVYCIFLAFVCSSSDKSYYLTRTRISFVSHLTLEFGPITDPVCILRLIFICHLITVYSS